MRGRTLAFKGFSRGAKASAFKAPGRHYYHVPLLVTRNGRIEATSFEANFTEQINGHLFMGIVRRYQRENYTPKPLKWLGRLLVKLRMRSEPTMASVVALAPYYLGFVPEEPAEAPASTEPAAPDQAPAS